jgi:general stress protein 26
LSRWTRKQVLAFAKSAPESQSTLGQTIFVATVAVAVRSVIRVNSDGAELIRDKTAFQQHWTSDLDKWFDKGVDTPGIVLIKVKATRATYWKGREEGEVDL